MKILAGKIDVTKISKERLFQGKKGTYLDFTVILRDEKDKYGNDGFVSESTSKEERESGVKGVILGDIKVVFDSDSAPKDDKPYVNQDKLDKEMNDDLPF